ncbi:hypothetical protein [Parvimonas micra]
MNLNDLRYKDLIDDLLLINVDKLTDDELEKLMKNIEKLTQKIALVMTVRYLVGGESFNE